MVPISDNSCGVRCTKYPDVSGVNKAVLVSYSLRMGLANTEYSFSKRLGLAALRDWEIGASSHPCSLSGFCRHPTAEFPFLSLFYFTGIFDSLESIFDSTLYMYSVQALVPTS